MELPRYPIELRAHDPAWLDAAEREIARLREALGTVLVEAHHVGSTAVPGLRAKPILDLVPVVTSLEEADAKQGAVEALGYVWCGECGIAGRRYCVLFGPTTTERVAQLHLFARGSAEIGRHLRFRDYLRAHPDEATAYEAVKVRARTLHPDDVIEYNGEKSAWIEACERRAALWAGIVEVPTARRS